MTDNTNTTTDQPGPFAPAPPQRPALRRSRTDRVIGGVAGGVGEWLAIDPVIVRVVLVVLAVFGGSGLLLYAAGWLFIPEVGETTSEAERFIAKGQRPGSTTRTVLIAVAAVLIAATVINILAAGPLHVWGFSGAGSLLLLMAVGGVVLWQLNRTAPASVANPPAPPAAAPAPATVVTTATALPTTTVLPTTEVLPADGAPVEALPRGFAYGGPGSYPGYNAPPVAPVTPRPPKARSYLGLATLSVALITMGVLATLSLAGVAAIPVVVVLAAGVAVLGLGLLVGAVVGRARWLMALGIPLLLVVALVASLPSNLHLPTTVTIGDRTWAPTSVSAVVRPYDLTIGDAVLDLTDLSLPTNPAAVVPVSASVGIGQLIVKVPAGMRVVVDATTGLGEVKIDGLPVRSGQNVTVTTELPGASTAAGPTVDLTAQVGIGSLEVSRA